jgi:hypothetical protein
VNIYVLVPGLCRSVLWLLVSAFLGNLLPPHSGLYVSLKIPTPSKNYGSYISVDHRAASNI